MSRIKSVFCILLFSLTSYVLGAVTIQNKIFPYEIIRTVKNIIEDEYSTSSTHYLHRKSFFEVFGKGNYEIVFIGDSITELAEWEDIFPSYKIANRGVNGDTSAGILKRIDSVISTNAEKAFIMLGINDFNKGVSVSTVFDNYKNIIQQLELHGFKIYIQSTILAGSKVSELNGSIAILNTKLKELATKNPQLTYIDLNESLSKRGLLSKSYSEDDIHLNGIGYKAWQEAIHKYIESE